jgi:hypothetical protein
MRFAGPKAGESGTGGEVCAAGFPKRQIQRQLRDYPFRWRWRRASGVFATASTMQPRQRNCALAAALGRYPGGTRGQS